MRRVRRGALLPDPRDQLRPCHSTYHGSFSVQLTGSLCTQGPGVPPPYWRAKAEKMLQRRDPSGASPGSQTATTPASEAPKFAHVLLTILDGQAYLGEGSKSVSARRAALHLPPATCLLEEWATRSPRPVVCGCPTQPTPVQQAVAAAALLSKQNKGKVEVLVIDEPGASAWRAGASVMPEAATSPHFRRCCSPAALPLTGTENSEPAKRVDAITWHLREHGLTESEYRLAMAACSERGWAREGKPFVCLLSLPLTRHPSAPVLLAVRSLVEKKIEQHAAVLIGKCRPSSRARAQPTACLCFTRVCASCTCAAGDYADESGAGGRDAKGESLRVPRARSRALLHQASAPPPRPSLSQLSCSCVMRVCRVASSSSLLGPCSASPALCSKHPARLRLLLQTWWCCPAWPCTQSTWTPTYWLSS
jgi:hypothetical protein